MYTYLWYILDMKKTTLFSLVGGLGIALLTGLVSNRTLLGGEWYGYPFAWLIRRILAPEYFPWNLEALSLIADVAIWTLVTGALLTILLRASKKQIGLSL